MRERDPLDAPRGIAFGVLFSAAIWVALFCIIAYGVHV